MRRIHLASMVSCLALAATGCWNNDIDRTQPDKVRKCTFTVGGCNPDTLDPTPAEYYFARTVIDVPSTDPATFVGNTSDVQRVIFDVTEDTLYVYRAHPWLTADDGEDVNLADDYERPGTGDYGRGPAIAAFPVLSHFDVIRDYNAATGEQTNVLVENTTDRPWYEREYMRVNWSDNLISSQTWYGMSGLKPVTTAVTPQQDSSHDSGDEATVITESYVDFVQNWLVEGATLPGSEEWFGFPIPYCWLYSSIHTDCAGGVVKVRFSFNRVQEHDYMPLVYDDNRMGKYGLFRTERYTTNDEYYLTEQGVIRLGHRWNTWKDWSCYNESANRPFSECTPDNIKPIVYHLNQGTPAHIKDAALQVGQSWNSAFKEAVLAGTGWDPSAIDGIDLFVVCPNNPVEADDPEACGRKGTAPKIGDLRYSFLYYVPEQHSSSPLGYGPSHADFFTGELFAGMAYFYGAPARWIARRALDIFKYDEGLLTGPDIGEGVPVRDRVRTATGEDIATQIINARGQLDLSKVRERLDSQDFRSRVSALKERVASGEAFTDPTPQKRAALEASTLNQLLVTDEIKKALGVGFEDEDSTLPDEMFTADRLMSEDLFTLFRAKQNIFAAKRTHLFRADEYLEESFLGFDERYVPMFEEIRQRFMQDGVLDEDGAMDFIEARIYIDTQLHELGHTLGMRHNFAGSADALNFGPQFWQLRMSAGPTPGLASVPVPEYLIANPAAFDDAIRQGMRSMQSTAVMEYMSTYGTDTTMGEYETALLKYAYYDTAEIFDRDAPGVDITPERAELLRPGTIHYTWIPNVVSDAPDYQAKINAMYSRDHINYRIAEAEPEIIEVPYKFCSDEYAGGSPECERWDQGMDNFERVTKRISDFQNYYWFDAFKRERLGFGVSPFDYVSRLYNRTFRGVVDQYKHWVNEELIVRSDQSCVYWYNGQRFEESERLFGSSDNAAFACGLSGYAAGAEAMNMLADVLATPNIGCYARLQRGCYTTAPGNTDRGGINDPSTIVRVSATPADCNAIAATATVAPFKVEDQSSYYHVGDSTFCPKDASGNIDYQITDADTGAVISLAAVEVPLGVGKPSRTIYDRQKYGYTFYWKPTVMGSWWEKWMAVKALYDHETNFIGVDASADTASYLISLATLFGDDINNLVSAAINEEGMAYGPFINTEAEVVFPKALGLFTNDATRDTMSGPTLDPDQEYTFRLIAMMNAAYQSSEIADIYEFAEGLRVERCFSNACLDLPASLTSDPDRFQQVTDPVTGEVWYGVRPDRELQTNVPIYSPGYELIRKMKNMFYVGGEAGPGTTLLPGVAVWQPRGELRFLNIMSGVYRVFRYGEVWSGDIGL